MVISKKYKFMATCLVLSVATLALFQNATVPVLSFADKVKLHFGSDSVKSLALIDSYNRAKRLDLLKLNETDNYKKLKSYLNIARTEYEAKGAISPATLQLLASIGVKKYDKKTGSGISYWILEIDPVFKSSMRIFSAASIASTGFALIESYHQLSDPKFAKDREVFLTAIEQIAQDVIKYSDENGDGHIGWGRVWFKGSDGLLLHTTLPKQNMYFGGYTYFPASNNGACEKSLALKEEAYDHSHNTLFLAEAFLITRKKDLAVSIINLLGEAFDDTFNEGAIHNVLSNAGWYYWKSIGKNRTKLTECEVGGEVKNTNLRMGAALLAYSQILRYNTNFILTSISNINSSIKTVLKTNPNKYSDRAFQIIRMNNYEIFNQNNFGYQGKNGAVNQKAVYDRTQISVAPIITGDLEDIIRSGNSELLPTPKAMPLTVTICSGDIDRPAIDRGVAGSCWNHLGFEAEDYFRILRYSNSWSPNGSYRIPMYLDAIVRNLAAAKIHIDGKDDRYAHYFPTNYSGGASNEVTNAAFYGFFCMGKNMKNMVHKYQVKLPQAHLDLLAELNTICTNMPVEAPETGSTWKKSYKFNELYLEADRFTIAPEDWYLVKKL